MKTTAAETIEAEAIEAEAIEATKQQKTEKTPAFAQPAMLAANSLHTLTAGADMSDPILRQDDSHHVRLKQILAELELEIQNIDVDNPEARTLKHDFAVLKSHLDTPEVETGVLREHIGKTQSSAMNLMDSVEGAILKDSPYVAELGRILGMI